MSKYMFLFRGGDSSLMDPQADPQAAQAHMMKWKNWMDGLAAKGQLLGGEPLQMKGKVVGARSTKVTDGPFAEGKEVVGGYLIVNATTLDEAAELSKGCPVLEVGGTVEVRPIQELTM